MVLGGGSWNHPLKGSTKITELVDFSRLNVRRHVFRRARCQNASSGKGSLNNWAVLAYQTWVGVKLVTKLTHSHFHVETTRFPGRLPSSWFFLPFWAVPKKIDHLRPAACAFSPDRRPGLGVLHRGVPPPRLPRLQPGGRPRAAANDPQPGPAPGGGGGVRPGLLEELRRAVAKTGRGKRAGVGCNKKIGHPKRRPWLNGKKTGILGSVGLFVLIFGSEFIRGGPGFWWDCKGKPLRSQPGLGGGAFLVINYLFGELRRASPGWSWMP